MIKLTKDILLFTDLFEDISQIFSNLQNSRWQMWARASNDRIGERTFIQENEYLSQTINSVTQKCLDEYMNELNIDHTLYYNDGPSAYVRKWDFPMKGMSPHRDFTHDGDGNVVQVEYTLCGYLNDDYEGGLIEFPESNVSLKPPTGSAIVFPSNELHQVTDLIDKDRYMWSSFVYKR
jgi:predicted 2-oxoglutarate/Fe(II)-dependent dioxygenase YbiX